MHKGYCLQWAKKLWTKINDIPLNFLGDFKLNLTLLGLKTTTSTYPWPYCFVTLDKLKGLAEEGAEESEDYMEGEVLSEEYLWNEDFPCGIEAQLDRAEKAFNTLFSERTFEDHNKDLKDFKRLK